MQSLTMELERPWEKGDPDEVCFFGRADIHIPTMEARDIQIRLDEELLDLIELSVAETFDGAWAWMAGVDEIGGTAHSREAARAGRSRRMGLRGTVCPRSRHVKGERTQAS